MKRLVVAIVLCLIPLLPAQAKENGSLHTALQGQHGPLPMEKSGKLGVPALRQAEAVPGGMRDGNLLWTRFLADPIYTSSGIAMDGTVLAGNLLNPPEQVEALPLLGNGALDWTFGGTEFFVDASREAGVLASLDFVTADSTATVRLHDAATGAPIWSYVIHPCRSMVYQGWASRKPIQVSDDGSVIAVAVTTYSGGAQIGRLTAFSPASGTPIVEWDFPTGNVTACAISADGDFVAMAGWPNVYVYDVGADALRWSGPAGAGNDALAISGDGSYIAWGWTTFYLRRWNGAIYAPAWTHTPGGGLYVGQCALDPASGRLAVAWDNGNDTVNSIALDVYDLPGIDPVFHYDYIGTPNSGHVDIPSSIVFAPDGERLAVGSWGGSFPEIHVFDVNSAEPLFTLDTPGSIFDVDIVPAPGGASYVTACGKGVHAGTGGRGGYLYAIEVAGVGVGLPAESPAQAIFGLLGAYPNPFNPRTEIRYSLAAAGRMELSVHDASGRLVKRLIAGQAEAGEHVATWNGDDARGSASASGIYFLKLSAGGLSESRKIVLIQ